MVAGVITPSTEALQTDRVSNRKIGNGPVRRHLETRYSCHNVLFTGAFKTELNKKFYYLSRSPRSCHHSGETIYGFQGCEQLLLLCLASYWKMLLCKSWTYVRTWHMHFSNCWRNGVKEAVGCRGWQLSSSPLFEVRAGREPINTKESHVSASNASGGRHSQLLLSMWAHLQHYTHENWLKTSSNLSTTNSDPEIR